MMRLIILTLAAAAVVLGAPQYDDCYGCRDALREGIRTMRMPEEEIMPMPDETGFWLLQKTRIFFYTVF